MSGCHWFRKEQPSASHKLARAFIFLRCINNARDIKLLLVYWWFNSFFQMNTNCYRLWCPDKEAHSLKWSTRGKRIFCKLLPSSWKACVKTQVKNICRGSGWYTAGIQSAQVWLFVEKNIPMFNRDEWVQMLAPQYLKARQILYLFCRSRRGSRTLIEGGDTTCFPFFI